MSLALPGVTDPETAINVWTNLRDAGTILQILAAAGLFVVGLMLKNVMLMIKNQREVGDIRHQSNIERIESLAKQIEDLDACVDTIKAGSRDEATRNDLAQLQSGLQERMATNMTTATQLIRQREDTLVSNLSSIRDIASALETRVRRLEDHQMSAARGKSGN